MEEFIEKLSAEDRRELLDYLHRCRYSCKREGFPALFQSLSKLLKALERRIPSADPGKPIVTRK
jgi:hypothetical protein